MWDAAPLGVFREERGEWLGVALPERFRSPLQLLHHRHG